VNFSDTGDGHDRLLNGEDPATKSHAVATRWVRIYSDLVRAMADLEASRFHSTTETSSEPGQVDAEIGAQRTRYDRRLTFWEHRQHELTGSMTN